MKKKKRVEELFQMFTDNDEFFKLYAQRFNALLNIILGVILVVVNFSNHKLLDRIFFCLFISISCLVYFCKMEKFGIARQVILICCYYAMFMYTFFNGEIRGACTLWMFVSAACILLSSRITIGLILSISVLVSMLIFLFTPLSKFIYPYSQFDKVQYPIMYMGLFIISIASEIIRNKTNVAYDKANETLHIMATKDSLTGVSNLYEFMEKAEVYLFEKQENQYAMISLRLKGGTLLNDLYGCEYFNEVLKQIAHSLQILVDSDEIVARDNSSLFALLLKYTDRDELVNRLEVISKTLIDDVGKLSIKISLGIVEINTPAIDLYHIYHNSLLAQNHVNIKGNFGYEFYDPSMRRKVELVAEIEDNMKQSLKNGDFIIYYQPKFDIKKNTYTAAEALVRWRYVDGTIMSPYYFIPVFESNQFIISIDYYVFEKVCKDIRKWLDEGKEPPIISVNMSRLHIYDENFSKILCDIADTYKVPKKYLEIELTESALIKEENKIVNVLVDCHEKGFSISMDDFGSGYSSLHALFNLPINTLKLDKTLFGTCDNNKNRDVVYGIIDICKRLNIDTVAEGIETKEWVEILKQAGCDYIQGYYFARPVPLEEFEKLVFNQVNNQKSGAN